MFNENALWDQGTEPGYVTGPDGTAGNIMVGGTGLLFMGMGRQYPFALPMRSPKDSRWNNNPTLTRLIPIKIIYFHLTEDKLW